MIEFVKQFIMHPTKIGAILPSGRQLAKKMIEDIDFEACSTIVEYGPGTGVFTKGILKHKKRDTKFLVIEQNKDFYDRLISQYGNNENVYIVNGSVEDIDRYLTEYELSKVDVIVSGLPFTSLPKELTKCILEKTTKILGTEGRFITFQYSLVKKHIFERYFHIRNCKRAICNIPPAYVLTMKIRDRKLVGEV